MPIAPVLQRFVDDELSRAPALVERSVTGTLQLLRDNTDSALTSSERTHHAATVEALQHHSAAFQSAFLSALRTGVRQTLAEQSGDLASGAIPGGAGLELMDESRVEIDIEISRAMQLIDTTAEWELRELTTFTSTLVGQTHVSADSNPLRPLLYATALWEGACAATAVPVQRATLLRVAAGVTAGLLKSAWAAASSRLEAQGIEPGIYRTVLLAPGSTISRGPAPPDGSRSGALAGLLSNMPGGAPRLNVNVGHAAMVMGSGLPHAPSRTTSPEFEQAMAGLDQLLGQLPLPAAALLGSAQALAQRLDRHRAALVASATAPIDRQIIELLSRVFDGIVTDPQLPAAFVAIPARLQASALRVALHDADMLDSTRHPVWRLLDRIAETACTYPSGSDPRATELLACCHGLVAQIAHSAAPDATLYSRALMQLDAFVEEQLQAQRLAARPAIQTLQLAERRELLEQLLAKRLVDQMMPVRTTPAVRRFMTGPWARVLAESMLRDGEQAETTRGYIKLVDELLWSVQLPDHPQSRARLVGLLPALLKRLRAGMALIALPAADQQAVLDELMVVHTEALRPGGSRGESPETATLTPQQIVQRMREEVLPAATGQGGFSDSVIDLASMETVPAELMLTEGLDDDPAKRIEGLRPGDRLRLFVQGRWSRVQLLWHSDQRLFYLFAGEMPTRPHSVTRRALERLASAGLMQPLETRSLVQRALDVVTRELVRPA